MELMKGYYDLADFPLGFTWIIYHWVTGSSCSD